MSLYPFVALAGAGLALSIAVHLSAMFGWPNPLGPYAWGLHTGVFLVWLPAVYVARRQTRDFRQADFWKAALRGCPRWMRTMMYAFFGYAAINFVWFIASGSSAGTARSPNVELRGFSGHWMAFYSAALALLYSASRSAPHDAAHRCLQGHAMAPLAKFCEECGSPVRTAPPN